MATSQSTSKNAPKKGLRRFLPLIIIVGVIGLLYGLSELSTRTIPNDPDAAGNTACNLYNGGLFCLYEDKIYFSNLQDEGALYSMDTDLTGHKRLHDDMPAYLNATDRYLVYARMNYLRDGGGKGVLDYTNCGLFRINRKNGKNMKMVYSDPVGIVSLYGNDIFYQHYDETDGIDLHRAPLDFSETIPVLDSTLAPASIHDGQIYYAGVTQDHYIYTLTPSSDVNATGFTSGTETLIYKGNCYQPARVGDSIYFISLSKDYSIARVDAYGNNPTLLVQEHCSSYNVDEAENYLVYQVDDGENSRIECLNLFTLERTTIKYGNFCSIHILDDRVFFQEYGTTRVFTFELGETEAESFVTPIRN